MSSSDVYIEALEKANAEDRGSFFGKFAAFCAGGVLIFIMTAGNANNGRRVIDTRIIGVNACECALIEEHGELRVDIAYIGNDNKAIRRTIPVNSENYLDVIAKDISEKREESRWLQ